MKCCVIHFFSNDLMLATSTESETRVGVLRPIRIRNMLIHRYEDRRLDIQGILREVIKAEFVMRNKPGK